MITVKVQISIEDPENGRYVDESTVLEYEKPRDIAENYKLTDWIEDEVVPKTYSW